jgi:hypothetical protein
MIFILVCDIISINNKEKVMVAKGIQEFYKKQKESKVKLSSLQKADMEKLGITKQGLNKLCWKEYQRRFKVEDYDYKRNKNVSNVLRVVRRDILLLTRDYAKAIIFKGASYDPVREKVELSFNGAEEIVSHIRKNMDTNHLQEDHPIFDLIFAIEIFATIKKEKRINLPKYLSEIFSERYMKHTMQVNLITSPDKRAEYIASIAHFGVNKVIDEGMSGIHEGSGKKAPQPEDDLPYIEAGRQGATLKPVEATEEDRVGQPTTKAIDEPQKPQEAKEESLTDLFDIPVFARRESEDVKVKFQSMADRLKNQGEAE